MDSTVEANAKCLGMLQRQHLMHVPFENLDIHWGRKIIPDTSLFYKKIVERGRGGFCYELNGIFNELLRAIGFRTKMVSARVAIPGGGFGPEFDHLAIIAESDDGKYLVDVGFGDFTAEPLRFETGTIQIDPNGKFMIAESGEDQYEVRKLAGREWTNSYIFSAVKRDMNEFAGMCEFHQTSPDSHFTKGKLCSLMTENGRKTLTDKAFIRSSGNEKTENAVSSETEFMELLKREFGIEREKSEK